MIIEFKVSNCLSLRDPQTFSLVASAGEELEQNIFPSDADSSIRLVRAAVIYGANAGGKSNLLSVLLFMRTFVLQSAESQPGRKIPIQNFSFDKTSCEAASEFEITFIKDGVRYQYGFIVNEDRVLQEWLFAYPSGRAQQWFSRVYDKKSDKYEWKFSKFFKGEKHVIELTRSDVLFLSNSVKLNNKQLIPVFSWFQKDLVLIDSARGRGLSYTKSIDQMKTVVGKQQILKFMHAADPSISDIVVDSKKFSEEFFPDNMPQEVRDYYKKEMLDKDIHRIKLIHASGNISLDLNQESDGTHRLLGFAGRWIDALENGRVLVVDELDNSLHPLVVRFLIELICNSKINKKNAQLIFTTHDTSLLDKDLLRRDQIWFVEKDKYNATQLYSLLDFSPRKQEAIGKGYLQGRYGALPYVGIWGF